MRIKIATLKTSIPTLYLIILFLLLLLATKGDFANGRILYQLGRDRNISGPFELSNSTSRFALTESLGEDNTVFLREDLAKFASPDVVDYKGKFISIFTPGVSFIGLPFYLLGERLQIEQILTFASISIFAFLNILLITKFAQILGIKKPFALISGIIFLFATNALSYSQTFTQHHISTTFILICLINAAKPRTTLNNLLFGFMYGISVLIDIPNLILILPIAIYVLWKHFLKVEEENKIIIQVKSNLIFLAIGMLPAIFIFGWYNYQTTDSYYMLAQNIGRSKAFQSDLPIQDQTNHIDTDEDSDTGTTEIRPLRLPFKTRAILLGIYTLLISNERAWLHYSPVVLIGVLGYWMIFKLKLNTEIANLSIAVILINIILYAMFGDPWGGWAFGPRYLIPAAALVSAGIGIVLEKYNKNILFNIIFTGLLIASIHINVLGVLTTQAIPPRIEALNLSYYIPYTYKLNIQKVNNNESSNLLYNYYFKNKNVSLKSFAYTYTTLISLMTIGLYIYATKKAEVKNEL